MTSAIRSILVRADDAMNPVVVKELRQAVQSRFVTVTLLLFLVVLLVTIHLFLLNIDMTSGGSLEHGRDIFMAMQGIVAFTCIVFVPIYAGVRFAAERSADNVDLLFISTIRPSSIVWGKLVSSLLVAVLIYSAVLPFMTLTYLLRGIDLPTVFVVVGLHALVILGATMASLFLACIPATIVLKVVIGLIFGVALITTASYTAGGSAAMVFSGIGSQLNTTAFWVVSALIIEKTLLGVGLLFFLTVSMISPPSSNRAMPVRLFLMAAWLIELVLTVVVAILATGIGGGFIDVDEVILGTWMVGWIMLLSLALLVSICEREAWSPRVLRRVPRNFIGRTGMFIVSSGSAGGVLWCCAMAAITLLASYLLGTYVASRGGSVSSEFFDINLSLIVFFAYAYCYAMTGAVLRWIGRRSLLPRVSAVFALILLILGCIAPVIVAFFIWPNRWDDQTLFTLLFNPFGPLAQWDDAEMRIASIILASVWGGLVTLAALPWLFTQWRGFRRHEVASA